MSLQRKLTRRGVTTGLAISLSLAWASARAALVATPRTTAGPFYPDKFPSDSDNDLVIVTGNTKRARGQVTYLSGRVLRSDGLPVAGARVEIWQCDAHGRYHHQGSTRGPADPNFQGFGRTMTTADGGYEFRTIKPVRYPGRTPHIHFLVAAPDARPFITQMYVAGDPGNKADFLYQRSVRTASPAAVAAEFGQSDEDESAWVARFDIVIAQG